MSRRARLVVLAAAGVLLGLAAEQSAFGWEDARQWVPDLAVGWTFITCGLIGLARRPTSGTGGLMTATGFAWFLGGFATIDVRPLDQVAAQALYLHRGVLIHCVLSFPTGRLTSRLDRVAVLVAYAAATIGPVAQNRVATAALGVMLIGVAIRGYAIAIGPARLARAVAVRISVAVGVALTGSSAAHLSFGAQAADAVLLGYQALLCGTAIALLTALARGPWEQGAITDLVVELTEAPIGTLRDALARTLGDPSIEVGYWRPQSGYVDSSGRPLALPGGDTHRTVTPIESDGQPLAILVHDPAVLDDPVFLASIRAAARLAAVNARLQAQFRDQIAEVEASRRRLLEASDGERRRLQRRLRQGAGQRLERISSRLAEARCLVLASSSPDTRVRTEQAERQLRRTLDEMHELARGLHPVALEERGLADALAELVTHSAAPIELDVSIPDVPREMETAAYFVCAEGIANLTKYASASSAAISVQLQRASLVVLVADDGAGGADVARGSGLRGLADRVEALGGRLTVGSPPGAGTRLTAELPLGGEVSLTNSSPDLGERLAAEDRRNQQI